MLPVQRQREGEAGIGFGKEKGRLVTSDCAWGASLGLPQTTNRIL
jgi:hypothetical protein